MEVIWFPGAVGSRNVHGLGRDFDRLAVAVLDWSNLPSVMLGHILFHHFIVSIHFLPDGSVYVAKILCGHQVELCLTLPGSIRLDQGCLVPIIHIITAFVS